MNKIKIKEIFASVQGEGPFVGYKQLFIRFCGCNLNCEYCDTDYDDTNCKEYSIEELLEIISKNSDCHSISLTGGEPLLHTEFLKEFLPKTQMPIYLETNATLYDRLPLIIDYVDYVACDIKLPSSTKNKDLFDVHDKFFNVASKKMFAKIVFDNNITDEEIVKSVILGKKYNIELILQPKNGKNILTTDIDFAQEVLSRFLSMYKKVRLIPQVHKYLNVR
ncbi:MAG: 7-carboxy-7-deazaguanine synthase QueE [bacterium]|nr:7-carboxy-7-deazaguanine synthase QueE [bacterium]